MKTKEKKVGAEVPFDPVLFAATVPSRKPTPKDLADIKKHENDLIEPKEYEGMDEMLDAPRPIVARSDSSANFDPSRLKFSILPAQSFFCSGTTGGTPP